MGRLGFRLRLAWLVRWRSGVPVPFRSAVSEITAVSEDTRTSGFQRMVCAGGSVTLGLDLRCTRICVCRVP